MNRNVYYSVSYIIIPEEADGQRVDNFLFRQLSQIPKSRIYAMVRRGEVRLDKKRVKANSRLRAGQQLRLPPLFQDEAPSPALASQGVLSLLAASIIWEDERFLVLNKPSGVAVHGGSGLRLGVIEAMRQLRPELRYLELAHRLDRETSGCLLMAKKASALRELHAELRDGRVRKHYLALVAGCWKRDQQTIKTGLRKNVLASGERLVRVDDSGKWSISHFTVLERFTNATLMQVGLPTGRTHQIRVHALHAGHPVAGDDKYGDKAFNQQLKHCGLHRLFLHAAEISFSLPSAAQPYRLTASLPADLREVLARL